jgi:preprotein translocase subunit SecG
MFWFLVALYVFICFLLVVIVLIQSPRGGLGSAFGGSSDTVFGTGTTSFLIKVTSILAAAFMFLTIVLAVISSKPSTVVKKKGIMEEKARKEAPTKGAPAPSGPSK